ncbi:LytR family transcriptional regulator, partial [Staphylococcus epidermidis]
MQRPDKKKHSSSKIMKWVISILVVLAIVAVAVIAATILIT